VSWGGGHFQFDRHILKKKAFSLHRRTRRRRVADFSESKKHDLLSLILFCPFMSITCTATLSPSDEMTANDVKIKKLTAHVSEEKMTFLYRCHLRVRCCIRNLGKCELRRAAV